MKQLIGSMRSSRPVQKIAGLIRRTPKAVVFAGLFAVAGSLIVLVTWAVTTPPVWFVSPKNGQSVSGKTVGVLSNVSNSANTTSVKYYLNGNYIGSGQKNYYGYLYIWDSTRVADGSYTLRVAATTSIGTS